MKKQHTGLPLSVPDPGVRGAINWTPILKIRVSANHQRTPLLSAIVDSGAPYCLFRADVADFLHLDLRKTPESSLGGIISGSKDGVHFHTVNIIIENNWTISVYAGFMKKLGVAAILGRVGFFDKFHVSFDHSKSPPEFEINKIELIN